MFFDDAARFDSTVGDSVCDIFIAIDSRVVNWSCLMSNQRYILSSLKLRFPRLANVVRLAVPSRNKRRKSLEHKSTEEVFSEIYETSHWGDGESRSGAGSSMKVSANIRKELPGVLADIQAKSILDAPCGDFHWMRSVELGVERYIGGDIVPSLIDELALEFADDQVRSFRVIDLTHDELPDVDVLFCRDCLQHLSTDLALKVIENFKKSSCKYLITTTFPDVKFNPRGFTGGMTTHNLQIAPFGFPQPLREINDFGSGDKVYRRTMGVWSREQIIG
jgi:hypothetical protein